MRFSQHLYGNNRYKIEITEEITFQHGNNVCLKFLHRSHNIYIHINFSITNIQILHSNIKMFNNQQPTAMFNDLYQRV